MRQYPFQLIDIVILDDEPALPAGGMLKNNTGPKFFG